MKDYTPGLLRHRCSNLMRIGKWIKVHKHAAVNRKCPNCGGEADIFVHNKFYLHIFAVK